MKTSRTAKLADVTIRKHWNHRPDHMLWDVIVTTERGYCYAAVYAGGKPTTDKVRNDWAADGGQRSKNWLAYVS